MKTFLLLVTALALSAQQSSPPTPTASEVAQPNQPATMRQAVTPQTQQAPAQATAPANQQPSTNTQQTTPVQPAKPKNCNLPGPLGGDPQRPTKPHKFWENIRSNIYDKTGEDPNKYLKNKDCPADLPPAPLPPSPAKPVKK